MGNPTQHPKTQRLVPYKLSYKRVWLLKQDLIFFTHMLITFNMAYTNKRSVLVRDRWKICKHYLSEDFAIDLMAVIPLDMFAIALGAGQRTASWLQIPKLLRINRVRVHIHAQLGNSASSRVRLMILGYSIVLFHFCACVWFSIGELPGDTWYTQYNVSGPDWWPDDSEQGCFDSDSGRGQTFVLAPAARDR